MNKPAYLFKDTNLTEEDESGETWKMRDLIRSEAFNKMITIGNMEQSEIQTISLRSKNSSRVERLYSRRGERSGTAGDREHISFFHQLLFSKRHWTIFLRQAIRLRHTFFCHSNSKSFYANEIL